MKIDAHHHYYLYNPIKQYWFNSQMTVLKHDFLPVDIENSLRMNNFNGVIAVHSEQSYSENDFLLGLTNEYEWIKGIVGWVDFRDKNLEGQLEKYAAFEKFLGIRHVISYDPDPKIMSDMKFNAMIELLPKYNLTYDLLIKDDQINEAAKFVKKHPNVSIILNHLGNPPIRKMNSLQWKRDIETLSRFENVCSKLSGLVTQAHWNEWEYVNLVPYLDHAFECFGSNRLIFGSDWPNCKLAGTQIEVTSVVEKYLREYSNEEQQKVMGLNAARIYNIKVDQSVIA